MSKIFDSIKVYGTGSTTSSTFSTYNSGGTNTFLVRDDGNVYSHGYGSIPSNTSFGLDALINVTGLYNTAFGTSSLKLNNSGIGNTSIGFESLKVNTTGNYNVSIGTQSLYSNINGDSCTSVGNAAMALNVSGMGNTAIGKSALYDSTSNYNTAIGSQSLQGLINGQYNTAIGVQSGLNSNGNRNVFIGVLAGANELGDDKLYISNSLGAPLIYGDFLNKTLNVNGDLGIANTAFTPSAKLHIKGSDSSSSNYGLKVQNSGGTNNFVVRNDGNVGIGTSSPTAKLDISGNTGYNQLRLRTSYTPTGSTDSNGSVGDVAWDDNYFYWKTSSQWLRVSGQTF
jgi:hypothetical protein